MARLFSSPVTVVRGIRRSLGAISFHFLVCSLSPIKSTRYVRARLEQCKSMMDPSCINVFLYRVIVVIITVRRRFFPVRSCPSIIGIRSRAHRLTRYASAKRTVFRGRAVAVDVVADDAAFNFSLRFPSACFDDRALTFTAFLYRSTAVRYKHPSREDRHPSL